MHRPGDVLVSRVRVKLKELDELLGEMHEKRYHPACERELSGLYNGDGRDAAAAGEVITAELLKIRADYYNGWLFWVKDDTAQPRITYELLMRAKEDLRALEQTVRLS